MKLVLDTNVWLDWLVFEDPRIAPLAARQAAGGVQLLATVAMRAELLDVLGRPHFGLSPARIEAIAARHDALTLRCPPAPDCRLPCSDRDDQQFIDLAVAHRSDWLLSRDRALLRLRRHAQRRFGVRIGTPETWASGDL